MRGWAGEESWGGGHLPKAWNKESNLDGFQLAIASFESGYLISACLVLERQAAHSKQNGTLGFPSAPARD